ncbi:MAG TPA: NRDE family protein [Acidimicrobiales bacterium]|nr:NRDE family protein [Acidimicrobiales bacterium]
MSSVCLLVVVSRMAPDAPMVVGANRDERRDRPATAATVLRPHHPRIVGGRDELAGGTWLAVNEHGVVAGLTNRPTPDGRDPTKRSRGELPLALASHVDARGAVEELAARVRPEDYNPAWLLVGDRTSLFYVDMTDGSRPEVDELGPGVHILENNPLGADSPKSANVRRLLGTVPSHDSDTLVEHLMSVLVDHTIPDGVGGLPEGVDPSVFAACVHTSQYGTRSSALVRVSSDPLARPAIAVADGHPCTSSFVDVSALWEARG